MKKNIFLISLLVLLIFAFYSCDTGNSGPDYSAVSVQSTTMEDLNGATYTGQSISSKQEFEEKILGDFTTIAESLGPISGGAGAFTMGTSLRAAVEINKRGTEDQTIDLATEPDSPFDSGTLTTKGSYNVYGTQDDETGAASLTADVDMETTLTNGQLTVEDYWGTTEAVISISGVSNVNALANFDMTASQTAMNVSLGYGVALSSLYVIDIDDRTLADQDVGAIIGVELKVSHSHSGSYNQTNFESMTDNFIPQNAQLELTAYNNDGTVIFTEVYDQTELMALFAE